MFGEPVIATIKKIVDSGSGVADAGRWAGSVAWMEDIRTPKAVVVRDLQEGKRDRCHLISSIPLPRGSLGHHG